MKTPKKKSKLKPKTQVSVLSKTRNHLERKVKQQADELKIKNGQLKNGVNKQHRAEEQIHIRTKAMESTTDGIFIIDAKESNFPVIYANQSFKVMTGYANIEIIGKNYFNLYGVDADPRVVREIKDNILKGKSFHGEMLNFRKSGEKYWNLLRIAPVRDSSGTVTHYVGIQTDVTLMRQRGLEIQEQRDELLHVTRVGKLAEFVSSLAHEVSQPLTSILSYAQAAQRLLVNREPKITEILQYIINDDQRAKDVIQRLRSLLKKSKPEMKLLNMNEIINDTVAIVATDVTVRNKVVKTELDANLPIIRGDKIQLQQVLLNLISNSLDAMENNPNSREILIRTFCKDKDMIIVEVKDSGCGIPEQDMAKLFSHFFTSKPDGLGMGLAISRSIVEAHGGQMDAKNNSGRGATFYFTIPVSENGIS